MYLIKKYIFSYIVSFLAFSVVNNTNRNGIFGEFCLYYRQYV